MLIFFFVYHYFQTFTISDQNLQQFLIGIHHEDYSLKLMVDKITMNKNSGSEAILTPAIFTGSSNTSYKGSPTPA